MEGKDIVKYALMAAAAYLLYEYLKQNTSLFGATTALPATTTPATTTTTTTPVTTTTTPVTTTTTSPATAPASSSLVDKLKAAAAGNAFMVGGMLNAHGWNYYRNQISPPELTPDQFSSAFSNPDAMISAEQFVSALTAKGLGGPRLSQYRTWGNWGYLN